jgi:hypothetical protein
MTRIERAPILVALALATALVGCDLTAPKPPVSVDLPPVESPPEAGDPMEVRLAEPKADDLAELLRGLRVEFHNWKYDGPECAVRLWAELKDDRVPGAPEIVAEGIFDLNGPDGRVVFALVPPTGPDAAPVAVFGSEIWGDRQWKYVDLPRLWFDPEDARTPAVSVLEEPFSIEEADGRALLEFHADREEPDAKGKPRRDRISLTVRMAVLPGERPADAR